MFSKCVATCNDQEDNYISCPRCAPEFTDAYSECQWNPSDRSQGGVCNYGCAFLILDPLEYLSPSNANNMPPITDIDSCQAYCYTPGGTYFNSANIYGGIRPTFCSSSGMACKRGCEYAIDVMNSPGQASGQTSTYEVIAPQVGVYLFQIRIGSFKDLANNANVEASNTFVWTYVVWCSSFRHNRVSYTVSRLRHRPTRHSFT